MRSSAFFVAFVAIVAVAAVAGLVAFQFWSLPKLDEIAPARVRAGDTVVLKGSRFARELSGNVVLFGDRTGRVMRAGPEQLQVQVPEASAFLSWA